MDYLRWTRVNLVAVTLLVGAGSSGCDTGLKTYPAGGIIKYKDGADIKQLAGGIVQFDSSEAKVSARGVIQPDGSFRLNTFKKDGAAAGQHRAMILPPPEGGISDNPPANVINRRYLSFKTSGFFFEVGPDPEKNHFVLEVEGPR